MRDPPCLPRSWGAASGGAEPAVPRAGAGVRARVRLSAGVRAGAHVWRCGVCVRERPEPPPGRGGTLRAGVVRTLTALDLGGGKGFACLFALPERGVCVVGPGSECENAACRVLALNMRAGDPHR